MTAAGFLCALGSIAAVAAIAGAGRAAPWRSPAAAGERAYRYEAFETDPDGTKGYRTDFRLRTDAAGAVTADILHARTFDGKVWRDVAVDQACARAMHASAGEIAEVPLYPLTAEQTQMGDAFLPTCAPAGVFFPLTDILNVVLIVSSDRFHIRDLSGVGQPVAFPGFSTKLDRPGVVAMSESSDGGEISLASLEGADAVVDWKPAAASLQLVEPNGLKLDGTEHFAFRVVIERRSGRLERADTLYDDLELRVRVPNLPESQQPSVTPHRKVSIAPLDSVRTGAP